MTGSDKLAGDPVKPGMTVYNGLEIAVVTASDDAGEGYPAGADGVDNETFAFFKAPVGEGKAPNTVIAMDIDSGIIEYEIRFSAFQEIGKDLLKAGEVVFV